MESLIDSSDYFTYAIAVSPKQVKIGQCRATLKHLKLRISECLRWNVEARLIALTYSTKDYEKWVHKVFASSKIQNEIFGFSLSLCNFLQLTSHWCSNDIIPVDVESYEDWVISIPYNKKKQIIKRIEVNIQDVSMFFDNTLFIKSDYKTWINNIFVPFKKEENLHQKILAQCPTEYGDEGETLIDIDTLKHCSRYSELHSQITAKYGNIDEFLEFFPYLNHFRTCKPRTSLNKFFLISFDSYNYDEQRRPPYVPQKPAFDTWILDDENEETEEEYLERIHMEEDEDYPLS